MVDDTKDGLIFIIGAPRSGTTWLAKIFDSHPDVLYRHEPDEVIQAPTDLNETNVLSLLRAWAADRSVRTATKPPFFPKSWQSPPVRRLQPIAAYALRGAWHLPLIRKTFHRLSIAELGDVQKARIAIKSVRWCEGIGLAARSLPRSRTILVLRQPRAQVFSMMRGASQTKFELRDGGRIPLDRTRAVACAASYNIDRTAFEALPDAAQYAWGWVAFNEAAERAVSGLANVQTIRYEDLCENPEHIARTVLSFAGLDWHPQTADFVRHSANYKGKSGYYSVFQHAALVSERWRTEMSEKDQWAVGEVARLSPLARHWLPELAPP